MASIKGPVKKEDDPPKNGLDTWNGILSCRSLTPTRMWLMPSLLASPNDPAALFDDSSELQ